MTIPNPKGETMLIILILFFCGGALFAQETTEFFSYPAEFERQDAIWMSWVDAANFSGESTGECLLDMIQAITPHEKVNLFIDGDSTRTLLLGKFRQRKIDAQQVNMIVYPVQWLCLRDTGPIFLRGDQGNLMIADMKWNMFGLLDPIDEFCVRLDTIEWAVARSMNLPIRTSTIASEGGNREFNGKGTMLAIQLTEMHRNRGYSLESIERELLRMFGQKKVIWLGFGPMEDDGITFGKLPGGIYPNGVNHIDEFCRFVGPNTILLAKISEEERDRDPMSTISYIRLEENYRILKNATDQDGRPFEIIRMPVPDLMTATYKVDSTDEYAPTYFQGSKPGEIVTYVLATSYLNFLITNGAVLVPSYWKEGRPNSMKQKDQKAKEILQQAFPDREVVQINAESLNHGGGGMECHSREQPSSITKP